MTRAHRITLYVVAGLALAAVLVGIAFFVLTRTEFGLQRVRNYAVDWVGDRFQGRFQIESVTTTSGLLGDVMLRGVTLDDPAGQPVMRADSMLLNYKWRTLAGGEVIFDKLELYDPELFISKMPGDTAWNYELAFADTTPGKPGPAKLVILNDLRLHSAHVEVRMPLDLEKIDEPADTARMILERVERGIVRVMRFEELNATVPRALWSSPNEKGRIFSIARLATRGYVWQTPLELQDAQGTVAIQDSIVTFEAPKLRFPNSTAEGIGRAIIGDPLRYDLSFTGRDIRFEDFQWVYPTLPDEGGGRLQVRLQTRPNDQLLLLVDNARIRTPGSELAGTFGVVFGDSLYFTEVDLRAEPLDMDLIRRLIPRKLPIDGLVVGSLRVEGT